VGDSSHQNGLFNIEIGKGNMIILQQQVKTGPKFQLSKKDITWLLFLAWPKAFGSEETNKTATINQTSFILIALAQR
jgi:hypothetical protein